MLYVSFVLRTNKIDQIRIGLEQLIHLDRPRLGVRLGIVDGDLDFQTPEVQPAEPLSDFACVRQRVGVRVEPNPVAKADRYVYQPVAVPFSD